MLWIAIFGGLLIMIYTIVRHLFALQPLRSKTLLRPDSSDPIRQRGVQGQVLAITP